MKRISFADFQFMGYRDNEYPRINSWGFTSEVRTPRIYSWERIIWAAHELKVSEANSIHGPFVGTQSMRLFFQNQLAHKY